MSTFAPTNLQQIDHITSPSTIKEFENIGQLAIRETIEKFIVFNSTNETLLLDAGCNNGVEGYRLFQKGFPGKYIGVDSNPKALGFAKENLKGCNAELILADYTDIKLPDRQFDIVLTKDAIEHTPYYEDIMSELCRLTKYNLLVSMFIRMHDDNDFIKREQSGFHFNRYNRQKFYNFVSQRGFIGPKIKFSQLDDELLLFQR